MRALGLNMNYNQKEVSQFFKGWITSMKKRPFKTSFLILGVIIFCVICIFCTSYIAAKAQKLAQVENRVETIEGSLQSIAKAMETLMIAQQITGLNEENAIVLDYEPVPQSIRIIVGPLTNFPRLNYGYELQGKKIYIRHPDTLKRVISRLPTGVTVEYLRKIKFDDKN